MHCVKPVTLMHLPIIIVFTFIYKNWKDQLLHRCKKVFDRPFEVKSSHFIRCNFPVLNTNWIFKKPNDETQCFQNLTCPRSKIAIFIDWYCWMEILYWFYVLFFSGSTTAQPSSIFGGPATTTSSTTLQVYSLLQFTYLSHFISFLFVKFAKNRKIRVN